MSKFQDYINASKKLNESDTSVNFTNLNESVSFSNSVQGDEKKQAEKMLSDAIKNLESTVKSAGFTIDRREKMPAWGADNMVFPNEIYHLSSTKNKSKGSFTATIPLAIAIWLEDGESALVSYGSEMFGEKTYKPLDKAINQLGNKIGVDETTGPTEHHYSIETTY